MATMRSQRAGDPDQPSECRSRVKREAGGVRAVSVRVLSAVLVVRGDVNPVGCRRWPEVGG